MSTCTRCGATFVCAMADGAAEPCWCTTLPPIVPLPARGARTDTPASGCWCPACLRQHIAQQADASPS